VRPLWVAYKRSPRRGWVAAVPSRGVDTRSWVAHAGPEDEGLWVVDIVFVRLWVGLWVVDIVFVRLWVGLWVVDRRSGVGNAWVVVC
jgi:hypothetical protein